MTPQRDPATNRPAAIELLVNGEPARVEEDTDILSLVSDRLPRFAQRIADGEPIPRGVAVAIDDRVVPRSRWADTVLEPGARVEIVTAVQGG